MLVIACVKQVPDTSQVEIDPATGTLVRQNIPFIANPFDTHALEESLRLKDRYGFRVAVLSMGPPSAEAVLKHALAVGVDRGVLLSDRDFAGADTLATSYVLSTAIQRLGEEEEVGMVICGRQTIDGDTAQVGPGIATRLKYSQLTLVDQIRRVDLQGRKVEVRRRLEGRYEIVEARLPAVIAVVREINRLRYPKVPMRVKAEKAGITLWDNKVLQLPKEAVGLRGSPTHVQRIFSPERPKGQILGDGQDGPEGAAQLLVAALLKQGTISV